MPTIVLQDTYLSEEKDILGENPCCLLVLCIYVSIALYLY